MKEAIACVYAAHAASATRRGRRGNELRDPTLHEVARGDREKEPENGRLNGRRNRRRLIPSRSIATKWKYGDARVKRSSKASCLGKWSAVAGADGFE